MDWNAFYEKRINSTYQDYFEKRYKVFLDMILEQNPVGIIETGCGIGSVSKALVKHDILCYGFDLNQDLVDLAKRNLGGQRLFWQADMFDEDQATEELAISHGVLEHFNDDLIIKTKELYPNSIHYVPLDKYSKPSFGDERLLPYEFWLDILQPSKYKLFNDDHDLCFKL